MFGAWFFATRPGRPFEILLRLRTFHSAGDADCTMTRIVMQQEFDCYGRLKAFKAIFVPVRGEGRKGRAGEGRGGKRRKGGVEEGRGGGGGDVA
eukprot:296263-Hanusia_phi.AAC.1